MLKKLIKIVPSAIACAVLSFTALAGENWNDPNFAAGAKAEFSGEGASVPEGYVPPIIGNGSIVTSVDFLGKQIQRKYVSFFPEVVWAGRRSNIPNTSLITMGHFDDEISIDGKPLGAPQKWKQTLDTRRGLTECSVEYGAATVKTVAFVPYGTDMLVVKKSVLAKSPAAKSAEIKFSYRFADKDSPYPPFRTFMDEAAAKTFDNSATLFYTTYGYAVYNGRIGAASSAPAKVSTTKTDIVLDSHFDLAKGRRKARILSPTPTTSRKPTQPRLPKPTKSSSPKRALTESSPTTSRAGKNSGATNSYQSPTRKCRPPTRRVSTTCALIAPSGRCP